MGDLFDQLRHIIVTIVGNLGNPEAWQGVLMDPAVIVAALVALNLIVFTETGLLVGFFLPGDSLLVTAGLVCGLVPEWPLATLIGTLCVSAVVGDSVGYAIGRRAGPSLFSREKSLFFAKNHLLAAQAFYERRGGLTIIVARFMPFVRTFAPVVAGIGRMNYRRFVAYNVVGGIGWVVSMVLFGYFLPTVIDPPLRQLFGPEFRIQKHIDIVIMVVVAVSVAPLVWGAVQRWRKSRVVKTA